MLFWEQNRLCCSKIVKRLLKVSIKNKSLIAKVMIENDLSVNKIDIISS